MKGGRNLSDMQHELKLKEYIKTQSCLVCGKSISGPYGRWESGWTCSKACNDTHTERVRHALIHRGNCEKA